MRAVNHGVRNGLRRNCFQRARDMALRILHRQIEMDLLVHIVEERERGGKNEDVNGGEQAQ